MAFPVRPAAADTGSGALDPAPVAAFISAQVQRHGIPGVALGIVEGERIVLLKGFGKADETGRAITAETPLVIASISKPLTALAVMQLVEAGEVDVDAPVERYVPDFRMADPVASGRITVRHLLLHTSGIPATSCDTRIEAETLAQFVAELRTVQLDAPAGARHSYCSGNYNLLGRVVEIVSGRSFAGYMHERVFAPLEMRHSFTSEAEARRAGMGQSYRWIFGLPVPYHERYNTSQLPSGYLISSAEDLTHFLVAQLNGGRFGAAGVLSPEGIAALQAPGVPIRDSIEGPVGSGAETYGLGWRNAPIGGVPVMQHAGDHADFHGRAFFDPRTRRGAVLLINTGGVLAVASAYNEIEAGVARLLVGQEPAPPSISLGRLYLIVDAVLGGLLALALWPLLRLQRWPTRLQQRHREQRFGRRSGVGVALRLACELGMPIVLLLGARVLIVARMGAQSWSEFLTVFPDFTVWFWALSLLLLLTGTLRLALTVRVLRHKGNS
ncbi:MAG: beta-lactamase family protein [Chloroflexota bacterium]|nr:beta-lactamase family protein [Chloroflexota bacterium]